MVLDVRDAALHKRVPGQVARNTWTPADVGLCHRHHNGPQPLYRDGAEVVES